MSNEDFKIYMKGMQTYFDDALLECSTTENFNELLEELEAMSSLIVEEMGNN